MKKLFKTTIIAFPLVFSAQAAHAGLAVTDALTHSRLVSQLNQMKENFEIFTQMRDLAEDTVKSIGEYGTVILPYTNMQKIKNQIKSDLMCLVPDIDLTLGIETEDVGLNLCDHNDKYTKALSFNPQDHSFRTQAEIREAKRKIKQARKNTIMDAAIKGLALADKGQFDVEELLILSDDILLGTRQATQLKDFMAISNQGDAGIISALAQINQTLLQLLRINAAMAIEIGVSKSSILAAQHEEGDS